MTFIINDYDLLAAEQNFSKHFFSRYEVFFRSFVFSTKEECSFLFRLLVTSHYFFILILGISKVLFGTYWFSQISHSEYYYNFWSSNGFKQTSLKIRFFKMLKYVIFTLIPSSLTIFCLQPLCSSLNLCLSLVPVHPLRSSRSPTVCDIPFQYGPVKTSCCCSLLWSTSKAWGKRSVRGRT